MNQVISKAIIDNAYTYEQFRNKVKELYDQGKPTSGEETNMPLLEFTRLNMKRMDRNERSNKLNEEVKDALQNFPKPIYWVVLAEGWCGDVAENLPVIHKMADATDKVDLRIILRDQNPEIMDRYLTNGGRSIPKLIALEQESLNELGTWGPRPKELQEFVEKKKAEKAPNQSKKEWVNNIHEVMHKWYAKDKGKTLQDEMLALIDEWKKEAVAL